MMRLFEAAEMGEVTAERALAQSYSRSYQAATQGTEVEDKALLLAEELERISGLKTLLVEMNDRIEHYRVRADRVWKDDWETTGLDEYGARKLDAVAALVREKLGNASDTSGYPCFVDPTWMPDYSSMFSDDLQVCWWRFREGAVFAAMRVGSRPVW
eukprot:SAG11_NODE_261_length_11530_cov_8.418861_14_plen_157_part_00